MLASRSALAQFSAAPPDLQEPIVITAQVGSRFHQGAYEVWLLRGACAIDQGTTHARSREAVVWIQRLEDAAGERTKVIAYFEGNVTIDQGPPGASMRLVEQSWLERFHSTARLSVRVTQTEPEPPVKPPIFERAMAHREPQTDAEVRQAQFAPFDGGMVEVDPIPPGARRVRAFPRGDVPVQAKWFRNAAGNEWIGVIDSGVNLIIDGIEGFGSVDISTDRMVIWTTGLNELDLSGQTLQSDDTPLEIYMEGNIVFRQGNRIIYAERLYYDARNEVGMVINAEVLTPVPEYEGLLRLRADVLQQIGRDRFVATNGSLTSSRLADPRYRIQSGTVLFEDIQRPVIDPFTGTPVVDPATGEPLIDHQRLATSRNNFLYLGPVPIFYWPTLATDLEQPDFYLERIQVRNDSIFGTQLLTDWDLYQLLGFQDPPVGTKWDLELDFFSERGPAAGTAFLYDKSDLWGVAGPYNGSLQFWGIHDHGLDNLGRGRMDLPPDPDVEFRNRFMWRHRHYLPNDFQFTGMTTYISDRNFLEQYFEYEWDQLINPDSGLELKRSVENRSWSITFDPRLNDFFTMTEWYPRGDHFWLGESLLGDWLTWYEHSSIGYGRLRVLSPPSDPSQLAMFELLPWEVSAKGLRAASRQELDLPLNVGPFKFVPYVLGELGHWGQDINLDPIDRAYGQVGFRASLPMWSVNPNIESGLFNVHGLAHKVVFESEFGYADANQDLQEFPLYDPVDDFEIEQFRRSFAFTTFGGSIPLKFDERFFAFRTGFQDLVTSPSTEIVDDLTALRLGVRQRWQTKRGIPGRRRIMDWITFDTEAVVFPQGDEQNFGSDVGLIGYDFLWHVGDRTSLVSQGLFDTFSEGQRQANVGAFITRPPRGNVYLGFAVVDGPINSNVLSTTYNYRMSPKWASTFSTSFDVGANNIGQYFSLTRIGESFLISGGANFDASKDNFGIALTIEPRFLPGARLGNVGGPPIPVPYALGLE